MDRTHRRARRLSQDGQGAVTEPRSTTTISSVVDPAASVWAITASLSSVTVQIVSDAAGPVRGGRCLRVGLVRDASSPIRSAITRQLFSQVKRSPTRRAADLGSGSRLVFEGLSHGGRHILDRTAEFRGRAA